MDLSISEENHIKAIYNIVLRGETATTNNIAEKMATKASSVTAMLRKLADKNLVDYEKYHGVALTKKGKLAALQTVRKHRLWEVFLVEKLGFGWDEVHDIAEELEHIQSPKLTDKLAQFLNHPDFDPHGDPIPDSKGVVPNSADLALSQCVPTDRVVLQRVKDGNAEFLQYLERVSLHLGEIFTVSAIMNFDQSIEILREDNQTLLLSHTVCKNLFVKKA